MLAQRGRFDVPRLDEVKPKMAATLYVGNHLPARFVPAKAQSTEGQRT